MKILSVVGIRLEEFLATNQSKICDSNIMICGFGVLDNLDLIEELKGNTNVIRSLVKITENKNLVAIAGINATLYKRIYRSVVVIENGKIYGISDMLHNIEKGFDCGRALRMYDTTLGKIGVLVGDDILFPECARALRKQGSEILIHIAPKKSYKQQTALSANALFNGISIITVSRNDAMVYNFNGEIISCINSTEILDINTETNDLLIKNLRPEIYKNVYTED